MGDSQRLSPKPDILTGTTMKGDEHMQNPSDQSWYNRLGLTTGTDFVEPIEPELTDDETAMIEAAIENWEATFELTGTDIYM